MRRALASIFRKASLGRRGSPTLYSTHYVHLSFRSPPKDPAVVHVNPQRHVLQLLFSDALTLEDVEQVFIQSLDEIVQAYHPADCAEPLLMAFEAYTRVVPLGKEHTATCLAAMDAWEKVTQHRAPREVYHRLLTIYGANPREVGVDYSEEVLGVITRMREKEIEPDDWSIFLVRKVLCNSGYAED